MKTSKVVKGIAFVTGFWLALAAGLYAFYLYFFVFFGYLYGKFGGQGIAWGFGIPVFLIVSYNIYIIYTTDIKYL